MYKETKIAIGLGVGAFIGGVAATALICRRYFHKVLDEQEVDVQKATTFLKAMNCVADELFEAGATLDEVREKYFEEFTFADQAVGDYEENDDLWLIGQEMPSDDE